MDPVAALSARLSPKLRRALLNWVPGLRPAHGQLRTWSRKYHRWRVDPPRRLEKLLRHRTELFIVQIGSNDGKSGDPIFPLLQRNPSWKALVVEPIPFLFERLKQNYRHNPNVQCDNVAVMELAGTARFYYLHPAAKQQLPDLPDWFDQLGSFDPAHIARHWLGPAAEQFIVSVEIDTIPLATLLERNHVSRIDLLHIDTEGSDWVVLRQLDLSRWRPEVILFEHKHLSPGDKRAAEAFLEAKYKLSDLDVNGDYLCVRRSGAGVSAS